MPALYGITSNANVSVSNTTGLYIGSGNVTILNSAGTLLSLLSNAGTVGFYSTNNGTQVAASVDDSGVTAGTYGNVNYYPTFTVNADGRITSASLINISQGTYGNANVTALLSGTVTVGNLITTAGVYWANGQPYSSSSTIYGNANVAVYLAANIDPTIQSLNANTAQQQSQINTITANIGSFYTYANATYSTIANAASQESEISSLRSNITAANAAIQTLSANLGSFETYANLTFVTTANATIYSNANVASYLPTYSGNITAGNVLSNNYLFANGVNILNTVSGTYGNANVAAYLSSNSAITIKTTANLNASNISTLNAVYGGSISTNQLYTTYVGTQTYSNLITLNGVGTQLGVSNNQVTTQVNTRILGANLSVEYNTVPGTGYLTVTNAAIVTGNVISGNINTNAISATNVSASNLYSNGYYFANGTSIFSVVTSTYGNANVAAYLPTYNGNLTAANISITAGATHSLSADQIYTSQIGASADHSAGGGALIGVNAFGTPLGVQANQVTTTVNTRVYGANLSVENTGGGGFLTVANTATVGNLITTGGVFWSNGSPYATSGGSYGNTQVAAYLSSGTVDTISTTGNITTTANVVATGNLSANNATVTNKITAGSISSTGNITANTGAYFVGDGSQLINLPTQTGTYSNANVASYLPTYSGNIQANYVSILGGGIASNSRVGAVSVGNLTFADTGIMASFQNNTNNYTYVAIQNTNSGATATSDYAAYNDQASYMDMGINSSGYSGSGNFSLPGAGYIYTGNTDLSIGTYGANAIHLVTNNAATDGLTIWANGNVTTGNINNTGTIVSTGNITAPNLLGTAQYFAGDLHGNVLYDSTKYRFFANAYPLTTPDNTKYANGFLTWIVPTPVYTAGVVQAPAAGSGLTTQGGQTLGAIMSANVYIAPAGGAGNRSTNGHMAYTQVMPTGTMAGVDRSRGLFSQLDVNLNGYTWGTMGSASQASLLLCASAGTTQLLGSGSAAHAVGFNSVVAVAPTNGNIAVQYATGTYNFISLASNSAVNGTTIQYARLVSGSVAGQTANLSIVNMIGIHTATGWATTGSFNPTNRYAVLNEDAGTVIQTNGNINVVSTATTGLNSTGVFTATALNAVTGVAGQFASVSNGTGKSGGAMAYWDTTNARWSWFDTNLAVS